jgi:hypothetical protein
MSKFSLSLKSLNANYLLESTFQPPKLEVTSRGSWWLWEQLRVQQQG